MASYNGGVPDATFEDVGSPKALEALAGLDAAAAAASHTFEVEAIGLDLQHGATYHVLVYACDALGHCAMTDVIH